MKLNKGDGKLLQLESMGAKIVLNMPNNKNSIAWKIYKETGVRQYKMFIGNICMEINDGDNIDNIKNIEMAFKYNDLLSYIKQEEQQHILNKLNGN